MTHDLEVTGLGFRAGGRRILRDVSFRFSEGESLAVIGPNGAGKTTLLRALAGIRPPSEGEIRLAGREQASFDTRAWARAIAYVPQLHDLGTEYTVAEMVFHGRYPHLKPFDSGGPSDRKAVEEALRITEMEDFAERRFSTLSGGERQKVTLATAIAQESRIVMMDEPTSFLDVRHQIETLELLTRLRDSRGLGLIFVTHDVNLALRLAGRVLALKGGRVQFDVPNGRLLEGDRLELLYDAQFLRLTPSTPAEILPEVRRDRPPYVLPELERREETES